MRSGGRLYDTTDPMVDHHHGTHCAGIIAASWNGMGVSGVTSGAKIMAIKVGNEKGSMMADAIIRGWNDWGRFWAFQNRPRPFQKEVELKKVSL